MLRRILFILLFALAPFVAAADFSVDAWPYMKPIGSLPELSAPGYVVVPIDLELAANAASAEFADLRVADTSGQEVGSVVMVDPSDTSVLTSPASIQERREGDGRSSTVIRAEFDGRGILTGSLELVPLSTENFSRRMVVEVSQDGKQWTPVAERVVSQIETDGGMERTLAASYSLMRAKYLRATIFNEDSRPIAFAPEIRFFAPRRTIVFEARPGTSYAVYFGNALATAPSYDLAQILPRIRVDLLPRAILAKTEANPGFIQERSTTALDRESTTLNVLFVALSALLFLVLVFVLRNAIMRRSHERSSV